MDQPSMFGKLPKELVLKIFLYLKDDRKSILALNGTCKHFCHIINNFKTKGSLWQLKWPLPFKPPRIREELVTYQTLIDLLSKVRFVPFTSLELEEAKLRISSSQNCDDLPPTPLATFKFDHIVDLDLKYCQTTSVWLASVINNLPYLSYLRLIETTIICQDNTPEVEPKKLEELCIFRDKTLEDSTMMILFGNLAPSYFNVSITSFESDRRVMNRYYKSERLKRPKIHRDAQNRVRIDRVFAQEYYSKDVLTFDCLLSFMEIHHENLTLVTLDATKVRDKGLLEFANHPDLQHVQIEAYKCFHLSKPVVEEVTRLWPERVFASNER